MHGAIYENGRCRFSVWAPHLEEMVLHIVEPEERVIPMARKEDGTYAVTVDDVAPGALYFYRLGEGWERPDPASRHQPRGVHGPSAVVDSSFEWHDQAYHAPTLPEWVIYELHVGTFSAAGTFDGVIDHLEQLRSLGVNAVELMPVAQFPGGRNWGYDGVYPYAVQDSYGGLMGLQRLVDACHQRGMAVILDVVYNHLGPEGNYLAEYGPYFTERYHTPWGAALNFDGAYSDEVRQFFIDSALFYVEACHIDAFRIDAVHAIIDTSARPFLQQLTREVRRLARTRGLPGVIIGESDLNDARVLLDAQHGGLGMDAQWSDDFHHAVHAYITGERGGYYLDFGALDDIARAYSNGYIYTGQYSVYRRRRHGNSPMWCSGSQFVVHTQNHDQVGNRAKGDRLSASLSHEQQKLLACLLLTTPYVPLLFMGQEYGEVAPFQYFTSHSDPDLANAVRDGRRGEFAAFGWNPEEIPDPQDDKTFKDSRLDWDLLDKEPHRLLWRLYRRLIALRRSLPALSRLARDCALATVYEREEILLVRRSGGGSDVVALFDMRRDGEPQSFAVPLARGCWRKVIDTSVQDPDSVEQLEPFEVRGAGHAVTLSPSSCQVFATERS